MGAYIMDFGRTNEGVYRYRVNGSTEEIEKFVADMQELGCELHEPCIIDNSFGTKTSFLKFQFPKELDEKVQKEKAEQEQRIRESNKQRDLLRGKNIPDVEMKNLEVKFND